MPEQPAVDVLMVVHNGKGWLPWVLDGVRAQTHGRCQVHLLDSASTDGTGALVAERYPEVRLRRTEENIGVWAGMERLAGETDAPYVLVLTDVVLAPDFVEHGVRVMERQSDVGGVQSRMLQGTWTASGLRREQLIDSLGFAMARSRHVTNAGQGTPDRTSHDEVTDIFGVEGAAPLFRRSALESCRVEGHLIDPDYRIGGIGYGDDLDLAWRMRLFGHRQVLVPAMRAWHDRSTTHAQARGLWSSVRRRHAWRSISREKRRLDWVNNRFTMLKNDFAVNVLRDLPRILLREVHVLGYTTLFDPRVHTIVPRLLRLAPRMLRRRRAIMRRARTTPAAMRALMH